MSRFKLLAGLVGRMKEQRTLMEATEFLKSRPKVELDGDLPKDLPKKKPAVEAEGRVDPELNPALDPNFEVRVNPKVGEQSPIADGFEGAPFTAEEGRKLIDAAGEQIEGEVFSTLNVKRINTEEQIAGFVNESIRIKVKRGDPYQGSITFREVRKEATGVKWRDITKKQKEQSPLSIAELRRAREVEADLITSHQAESLKLRQKLDDGTLTAEEEFQYGKNSARIAAVSNYINGEKRRLAQGLAVLRDEVDIGGNQYIRNAQRDTYLEALNATGASFGRRLDAMLAANSVDEAMNVLDNQTLAGKLARIMGNVWFNSVLSLYAVPKAFIGGAVINKVIFPIEHLIAAGVSKINKANARNVHPAQNQRVLAGEAMIEVVGIFQGFRDALAPMLRHLKDPDFNLGPTMFGRHERPQDPTFFRQFGGKNLWTDVITQVVDAATQNGSFRQLKLVDMMVKSVSFQQRVKSLAYRAAAVEGLEGEKLVARVREILEKMPDSMYDEAALAGKEATLTQPLINTLNIANKPFVSIKGLKFFAPFTRTFFAGMQLSMERLPVVAKYLSPNVRAALEAGGAQRDMAIAKQVLGGALIGMGAMAAMNGSATSGAFLSRDKQRSLMKSRWRPTSLVNENGYFPFNFLSPVHELFMFGASMYEMYDHMNDGLGPEDPAFKSWAQVIGELALGSAWMFADVTLNKSVGRGLRELFEALEDPSIHGKHKITSTIPNFFLPWGAKHTRRIADPDRRRIPEGTILEELLATVKNNLPGLSDDLPPQIGYFGEKKPPYGVGDLISYSPSDKNSEIWAALYANEIRVTMPTRTMNIGGINVNLDTDLDPAAFREADKIKDPEATKRGYAYYRYSIIRGELYRQLLGKTIKTSEFKALPVGAPIDEDLVWTQGDQLQKTLRVANGAARAQLQAELGNKMNLGQTIARIRRSRDPLKPGYIPPAVLKQVEQQSLETDQLSEELKRQYEVNF